MVLRQRGSLAVAGLGLGIVTALSSARLLRSMLYGVGATDPLTYLAIAGLVVAVALIASYVPARRAARLDPVQVLRGE